MTGLRAALLLALVPALPPLGACASAPAPVPTATRPAPAAAGTGWYGPEPELRLLPAEAELLAAARARLGGKLVHSPALSRAARELAARRAAGDPAALSRPAVRLALARAGALDDAPTAQATCATDPDPAQGALAPALVQALPVAEATHAGAGVAGRPGTTCAVLLVSRRRVRLERFPRQVAVGERAVLRGRLIGLARPHAYATAPDGKARELEVAGAEPFSIPVTFDAPGLWRVELVGTGPSGPQVAALLLVSAGGAPLVLPEEATAPDPADAADAEALVLDAVNALRGRHGLDPLSASGPLREAARRQAAAMLASGRLAHVLPGSGDVGARLRRAGIPFRRVFENLARGSSALEAQWSLEESPAHLANLLEPRVRRIGVGLARGRLSSGAPVDYLAQLLVEPVDDASESRLRPEELVREALWRERARSGRTPLLADPVLDTLAARAARAMLRAGAPGAAGLPEEALARGRSEAAADVYVAASPSGATRSRNVGDARFHRVGVGVAVGDSPRYGAGLLWIVVLYSD